MKNKIFASLVVASIFASGAGQAETVFKQVSGVSAGDTLNVRLDAGSKFQDIGDIQPNEVIAVLGYDASGNWAKILYQGQIAYVSARYLSPLSIAPASPTSTGPHVVKGIKAGDPDGGLVVRKRAGTGQPKIGVLTNRTPVNVIKRTANGKWAKIQFGNGTGWVSGFYLNALQTAVPQPMPSPTPQTAPDGGNLPAMFTVTGVAANDSLNFRDAPNASANIIGRFAPGAQVQVLNMASGNWAYVTDGETAGYVSTRFLTRNSSTGNAPVTTANGFILGITCHGTEPFWSFEIADDRTVTHTSLVNGTAPLTSLAQTTPSTLTGSYPFAFSSPPYSGLIRTQQCSDGMSDNSYTMSIQLNTPTQSGGTQTLNGCCNIQP